MKRVSIQEIEKYDENSYIWYACYGSNINEDRFMIYINGDKSGKLAEAKGCSKKDKPLESKPYILNAPIYFASHSKKWNCGVAFLDYEGVGNSYGKIYKIRMSQFKGIYEQENAKNSYNAIIYVDKCEGVPIFTFTAPERRKDLEPPSKEYCDVMKKGILDTYKNLDEKDIDIYFQNIDHKNGVY